MKKQPNYFTVFTVRNKKRQSFKTNNSASALQIATSELLEGKTVRICPNYKN